MYIPMGETGLSSNSTCWGEGKLSNKRKTTTMGLYFVRIFELSLGSRLYHSFYMLPQRLFHSPGLKQGPPYLHLQDHCISL